VIGDAMLDKYIYGIVERISPEAPVPILTHSATELKAGGAANVALNLAAWGCKTALIGVTGKDRNGEELKMILDQSGITHYFFESSIRPTTVKTRVVAASHHLLRIDEESSIYLNATEEGAIIEFINAALLKEKPELIIIEDYNKGLLTEKVIAHIIAYGRKNGSFIAIDPKEKNFMAYNGVDLFKPNLREANLAAHKNLSPEDLVELSSEWQKKMELSTIAITLGSQGVFLHNQQDTEHIKPVRAIDVVDVCGAGDAVICSLALAIMSGLNLKKSGALANLTGAYVCSHSGVVTIDPNEIESWL